MSQNLFLESAEIQWTEEAIFAKVESKTGLKIGAHHDEVSITEVFDLDFKETYQNMGTLRLEQLPLETYKALWNII